MLFFERDEKIPSLRDYLSGAPLKVAGTRLTGEARDAACHLCSRPRAG